MYQVVMIEGRSTTVDADKIVPTTDPATEAYIALHKGAEVMFFAPLVNVLYIQKL